jgi:hypothetical protein
MPEAKVGRHASTLGGAAVPPEILAAARRILRHIHQPRRLRNDPKLAPYLPDAAETGEDDHSWLQALEEFVRQALAPLPPRMRIVVERTAFHGEPIGAVAASLGLSERQIYRDRLAAADAIARYLMAARPGPRRIHVSAPRSLDLQLSYIGMLEQVGQLDAAETTLSRLAAEMENPRDRSLVNSHLARLFLEQGRRKNAESAARRALSELVSASGDTLATSEAESVLGDVAFGDGDITGALLALRRAAVGFRSLLRGDDREYACGGLARTLVSQSQVESHCGLFREARDSALEAHRQIQET